MPGLIPIARLLEQIEENAIEGAKAAQKRHVGVRTGNYESSVSAGALHRTLKGTPSLITAFYDQLFWKGDEEKKAYKKNPKNLNKHCHQFVYGARDGSEGKRAEDHAFATQNSFDDKDKSLEQILEKLQKGGFDGLRNVKYADPPTKAQPLRAETEHVRSDKDDDHITSDGHGGSEPPPSPPASAGAGGDPPKKLWPKISMKQVFEHLLVAIEAAQLNRFLADKSKVGDTYRILIKRDADGANGMLIWRAVEIGKVLNDS